MKQLCAYYLLLIAAWCATWLSFEALGGSASSPMIQFAFWTTAKLLIWILPVLLIIRYSYRRSVIEYLSLRAFSKGVRLGLGFGLLLALLSLAADVFTKHFSWPAAGPPLLNVLIVAPLLEETVFRGFVLRRLQESGVAFWPSNVAAGVMFLGLHLPGWYFVGLLKPSHALVASGILLTGVVAGYAKHKSGSLWASVCVHFVNNLYSVFAR
jgi:CAAX protease family protein